MKSAARQALAQAVFETLESRICMSATVSLHDGVLLLQADANTGSVMQVQVLDDHQYIHASVGNVGHTFARSKVQSIIVVGSSGDDRIRIDRRLGLPASISAGDGNDIIHGGTGFDTIDGGAGNDVIYGHGILYAGSGDDQIFAHGRPNVLYGGSGHDLLVCGKGRDTVYGGSGHSTLIAGLGNDQLYAQDGTNTLYGGPGQDTLVGGSGNDVLYGGSGPNVIVRGSGMEQVHTRRHNTVGQALPNGSNVTSSQSNPKPTNPKTPPPSGKPTNPTAPSGTQNKPQSPQPTSPTVTATPPAQPTPFKSGAATKAVIAQLEQSIIAGEGVEVNAFNSVLSTGTALTAKYQWNFGDPAGRYNDLTGWNAGHIYDNPGVYTITLSLTDQANQTSTATCKVTVSPDTRPVIYVDNNGSDDNSGSSPLNAVQTAARAFQLATSDTKIEFHRGQTFMVNQMLHLVGHDMYVGAYGQGTNPVLMRGPGDGNVTIYPHITDYNTTIQDLTFDSVYLPVNGVADDIPDTAVTAEGTNVVVRNCTFLNVDYAVDGTYQPYGTIVQDNTAPSLTGLRGYLCWLDGSNWSILGNVVANSTRQHVVRGNSMTLKGVLIAQNNFSKVLRPEDPAEVMKTTINFREGYFVYITDNTLNDGTIAFNPGPGELDPLGTYWIVFQNNRVNEAQLEVMYDAHHLMVRNNLFNDDGMIAIHIFPGSSTEPRGFLDDIAIVHNTAVNTNPTGNFLEVSGTPKPASMILDNNLYVAPRLLSAVNENSPVFIWAADLSGFSEIRDNIWPAPSGASAADPAGVNYVANVSTATGYLTPTQWNAQSVVRDDQFDDVTLPTGMYELTLDGITAGTPQTRWPA